MDDINLGAIIAYIKNISETRYSEAEAGLISDI